MPRSIGVVISARLATIVELSTALGSEDVQDLLEILAVDAHNDRVINARKD